MKTLVIHPSDKSTDFLSEIYSTIDCVVITNPRISKKNIKLAIKDADRVVMLGHGSAFGLFGNGKLVIDSTFVDLLRTKHCIGIWCDADDFFDKYQLKGFCTGMIISEMDEASVYCLYPYTHQQIAESNQLLANCLKIDNFDLNSYKSSTNPIIDFNSYNLYEKN